MKVVKCWCCEHFYYFDPQEFKAIEFVGLCIKKRCKVYGSSDVCDDFEIKQGLCINRVIPK